MKKKINYVILLLTLTLMAGCTEVEDAAIADETKSQTETNVSTNANSNTDQKQVEETDPKEASADTNKDEEVAVTAAEEAPAEEIPDKTNEEQFSGYKRIEVDGGDLSGHREPKVAVDIGFGDREYWAFTNEHGQLVRVIADEIILQDDRYRR